jgi:mono/diheme cytochrome c family protein
VQTWLLSGALLAAAVGNSTDTRLIAQQPEASGPDAAVAALSSPHPLFASYCLSCHNSRLRTAGLAFDVPGIADIGTHAETWERVLEKLRMGAMPPPGLPRPQRAEVDAVTSWLETELDRASTRRLNPGRPGSVHRLNRSEYQNAIRDVLALEFDVESLLPVDDADKNGFDNVANALSVSPALLERYLAASRRLSRLALGIPPVGPVTDTYKAPTLLDQNVQVSDDLPLGSRGGFAVRHYFPVDGEYSVRVRLRRQLYDYIVGLGSPHRLEVRVDGALVLAATVGGADHGTPPPASFAGEIFGDPTWENYALTADAKLNARFKAKAGRSTVGVSFVSRRAEIEDGVVPPPRASGRQEERDEMLEGNPSIDSVLIDGPYAVDGPGDTPSRRTIMLCTPATLAEELPCARRILTAIARHAYRRPVTERDLGPLLDFFDQGRHDGGFESGLQFAIERILVDPNFLFRVEREPSGAARGTPYRLTDLELASRLSFFLWSSIPDDKLLEVATQGRLKDPAVLEQQVRRMLASPLAREALTDNFVAQWLAIRPIKNVAPSDAEFPAFDDNLREAFQQETSLFVEKTLRDDASVLDLLTANYTYVNERLARHYGIPDVHGPRFRLVTLPDDQRTGLLSHGSILTITSYPNRTSPVLRGKWLLDNVLGTPPPPPPPNVPPLPEASARGTSASVRARLEVHRKNPTCAACHAPMDPLGFALEHFDAIGGWRTMAEDGNPVDASGSLPDGTRVEGLAGLRDVLMTRREQFVGTLTGKLLSYAIGRGLEFYDRPVVRRIARESRADDYRWSSLILGIAQSAPFQMRVSGGDGQP